MKQSMKRRLQSRFVLLAVAALLVLQAGIVAFSIGSSYRRMTTSADRLILLAGTGRRKIFPRDIPARRATL